MKGIEQFKVLIYEKLRKANKDHDQATAYRQTGQLTFFCNQSWMQIW
jgi:hypothetical protein